MDRLSIKTQDIIVCRSLGKFDSSRYNETNLFDTIKDQGKIKNLLLIFSAFELGFGDAVSDLDLAKIDQYYKDNVTSLGKAFYIESEVEFRVKIFFKFLFCSML